METHKLHNSCFFNGHDFQSLGKATINKEKNSLIVSNLGSSGLDGFSFNANQRQKVVIQLEPIELSVKSSMTIVYYGVDYAGRLKVISQQAIFYDKNLDKFALAADSKLLPKKFSLRGDLNGKTVFQSQYLNPRYYEYKPKVSFIYLLLGLAIISRLSFDFHQSWGDEGSGGHLDADFGGITGGGSPPILETLDGIKFQADTVFLGYQEKHSSDFPREKVIKEMRQIQIFTKNINNITINGVVS